MSELYPSLAPFLKSGTADQIDRVIRFIWEEKNLPAEAHRDLADVMGRFYPNGANAITSKDYDVERPENSQHAAMLLAGQNKIEDEGVKKLILKFIDTPVVGPQANEYRWSESVEQSPEERLKVQRGIRRLQANHSLVIAQRLLVDAMPRSDFDKTAARDVITRATQRYEEPYFRLGAIQSLIAQDLLTPELMKDLSAWQPRPPGKKMSYSIDLLKAVKADERAHPIYEYFVLDLLTHPNAQVRSEAIDVLRSFTGLRHPLALEKLAAMRPTLTGFPRNVAQELTENMKLPEAKRPVVKARPLGQIRHIERRPFEQHPTYLNLMEDLFIEAQDFKLTPEQRDRLKQVQRQLWDTDKPNRFELLDKFSWGGRAVTVAATARATATEVEAIHTPEDKPLPHYLHSMPDFTPYLENRLGPKLVEQIQKGEVAVSVWAGELRSLLDHKKLDVGQLHRLPSPYSEWGIEKYLDFSTAKPTVHFVIPPLTEYAKHYDSMLKNIGSTEHTVQLSQSDSAKYRSDSMDAVKKVYEGLGKEPRPEIVALGYDYAIPDLLRSRPEWKVVQETKITPDCDGCGVKGTYLVLEHAQIKSEPVRMLLLSSDRSLWGEGSAFLAEGVLTHNSDIKDFWFFGSAGAPGLRNLYGVSVPDYFVNRDGSMLVDGNALNEGMTSNRPVGLNFIREPRGWLNVPSSQFRGRRGSLHGIGADGLVAEGRVSLITHTTHGQSHSPAEQTRYSVSDHFTDNRTHTVDVETNLLAQVVAQHNLRQPDRKVRFGVAHVVTDIPASNSHTFDSGRSLSEVDRGRKANAREVALTFAFDALEQRILRKAYEAKDGAPVGLNQGWSYNSQQNEYTLEGEHRKHSRGCNDTLADLASFGDLPPRQLFRRR